VLRLLCGAVAQSGFVQLDFPDVSAHKDAAIVLAHAIEKSSASASEKEAVARLWTSFLFQYFRFRPEWKYDTPVSTFAATGLYQVHDMVKTPYGIGVVEASRPGGTTYEVLLAWGRAILQAECLQPHVVPTSTLASKGAPVIEGSAARDLPPDVFFCSAAGYVFFQLYQILMVRL
jgi:hypothetical protein